MTAPVSTTPDLPVGAHVLRDGSLTWRRRVDWMAVDYKFVGENYRKLARGYEAIAAAIDAERKKLASGGRSKNSEQRLPIRRPVVVQTAGSSSMRLRAFMGIRPA